MHMVTFLFSPWGIPANYRQMQGSGVNTYKWVNEDGEAVLVKYHWEPLQGIKNLTQAEAEAIQAKNFNHATQDLYDDIKNGNFPAVGAVRADHERRRAPGAGLRSA